MKHIVHWGKYYPPERGGIESVTRDVATGAAQAGHRVDVVCFAWVRSTVVESISPLLRVIRAPILYYKLSQPVGFAYLWWAVKLGRRADIVHLHAPNMLAALAALFLGCKPKLVVHWHSDVINKGILGELTRPLQSFMLKRADQVVCTSKVYADASPPLRGVQDKLSIVPLGVPDMAEQEKAVLDAQWETKLKGRKLILAIGRLVPYKGFSYLVESAAWTHSDSVVVIVGVGPQKDELQRKIDGLDLGGRVFLAGKLGESDLAALFRRAYLFCLPSVDRAEAFGVVLIEAMSLGVPIVASRIAGSGVSWVNEHGVSGLNAPVGDARALAEVCNQILDSSALRESLSQGARRRYETEFTDQLSVERMLSLYAKLLTGDSKR